MKIISNIVNFFNQNYDTNHSLIIECLNRYFRTAHNRYKTEKMNGYHQKYQPSFPEKNVLSYKVYYSTSNLIKKYHKTGRILVTFTDQTEYEISLYTFKKYLRRIYKYKSFDF